PGEPAAVSWAPWAGADSEPASSKAMQSKLRCRTRNLPLFRPRHCTPVNAVPISGGPSSSFQDGRSLSFGTMSPPDAKAQIALELNGEAVEVAFAIFALASGGDMVPKLNDRPS